MPQLPPILSLAELNKLNQVKFTAHLKLKPTNLNGLLPEILANSEKYNSIIKELGIKFWCDWYRSASDDDKAARIALLSTSLPRELTAKRAFQALSSPKKRTAGTKIN